MITTRNTRKIISIALVALLAIGTAATAMAETPWELAHPRRDQVNDRLANQNRRIDQQVAEGELTRYQAYRLHQEDYAIRQEERLMASEHGGHITPLDQRVLNRQENYVSRQIGY